jgi:hypothetical protein
MLITQSTSYNKINPGDGFLEMMANKDHFKTIKSPRLFMSHVPYRYLPRQLRNGTGRIVFIQRNPKDLCWLVNYTLLYVVYQPSPSTLLSKNSSHDVCFPIEASFPFMKLKYETWRSLGICLRGDY